MAKRETVLSLTLKRAGVRKGGRVLATIMQWWIVHREIGHAPTPQEYGEWWKVSQATAYRERQAFQQVWPEFTDPSALALVLGLDPTSDELPGLQTVPTDGLQGLA